MNKSTGIKGKRLWEYLQDKEFGCRK
jgi:hypothetical protein